MATSSGRRIFQLFLPIIRGSYGRNVINPSRCSFLLRTTFTRPLSFTTTASYSTTKDTPAPVEEQNEISQQGDQSQISEMCDPYVEEIDSCLLCKANIPVSFKNVQLLSQFISPNTGLILDRKITRLCEFQQKRIEKEISIARSFGLMPFMYREPVFLKDPSLYSVRYTGNPNIGSKVNLKLSTEEYEKTKPVETVTPMMAVKKKKQPLFKSGKLIVKKKKKTK